MPSEKQIEAAAKAIYANAKNTDARDIARIALTAAEQAETVADAEPERKWPAFVYDSEAEPNMRTRPTPSEARLREALANLVQEIDSLISESEGVAGLHLNGDVAEWDDLLPGGPYERLTSLADARAALKEASDERA